MAGSVPTTSSSWAISDTANKTVTFATGMLEAATSDNISPITLKCCESFGSLLPLCIETRVKVEQLARRNHTSHVVNFIKAQIGYKKGDSVELLSRSDSGIRFLCLAATLCTLDRYDAANRLDALLQATAKEDQIRPTIKQLQVMMETLQTKLMLSDYTKSVVGWEIFSRAMLADVGPDYAIDVARIPSKTSLHDLVLALNEVGRIGELHSTNIKLKPYQLPWTGAFIQWCLGISPTIRTSSGKSLLEQNDSPVTLTVMPNTWNPKSRSRRNDATEGNLEVAVQKPLRRFEEIVFIEDPHSKKRSWQGLVDAKTWIQYQFSILHDRFPEMKDDKSLESAIGQALYFIIAILPERLILCDNSRELKYKLRVQHSLRRGPEDLFHATSPKPFLDTRARLKVAQGLLRDHITLIHEDLDLNRTLERTRLADIIGGACRNCASPQRSKVRGSLPCRVNPLLQLIGTIGSTLLTLTLFGPYPETYPSILAGPMFDTSRSYRRWIPTEKMMKFMPSLDWPVLVTVGWQPLMHGECQFLSCPPSELFQSAQNLMGHTMSKIRPKSTVISSKLGQVIFPAFFDANDFMRNGFMQLCAFPGKLRKDDMDFDCLIDVWSDSLHIPDASDYDSDEGDIEMEGRASADDDTDDVDQLSDNAMDHNAEDISGDQEAREEDGAIRDEQADEQELEDTSDLELDKSDPEGPVDALSLSGTVPIYFSASKRHVTVSNDAMEWKVAIQDNVLNGEMFLKGKDYTPIKAWSLMDRLALSRLTPVCKHRASAPAGDIGAKFDMSTDSNENLGPYPPRTLFNVGRSYAKQLACLSQRDRYPPAVVHVDGCIGCALRLCYEGRPGSVVIS